VSDDRVILEAMGRQVVFVPSSTLSRFESATR